jgi:hypothetical protein
VKSDHVRKVRPIFRFKTFPDTKTSHRVVNKLSYGHVASLWHKQEITEPNRQTVAEEKSDEIGSTLETFSA